MPSINKITPFFWFDGQAEEAANFYTSIFPDSSITRTTHYLAAGQETHGKPPGSVMTVEVSLMGHPFVLLNGGPHFTFSAATSFMIECEDQAEVDRYWEGLGDGGEEWPCGWVKDRFGVTWQV
jgi:predicted 3-demethylubiquinone-9 3-methyltransferase (glyoxalase superfamily)